MLDAVAPCTTEMPLSLLLLLRLLLLLLLQA
jgi:hypothetical protein